MPGVTNSGGSETQVFCYDEQNRLVWAGNSGTPSCSGNGTPSVSGSIAAYSNSFSYTNLGQISQGPLAGSGNYMYLYCGSQPHELTGLYPAGTTCSNLSGAVYTSSYDPFGNVTSRTTAGVTDTMNYDKLDRMTNWSSNATGQTQQEQYVYDANGNRVLRRSTSGPSGSPTTTITTYAFGLEEHTYTSTGTSTGNLYYYFLGGRLIGSFDGTNTIFYLTDMLGSIVSAFSNTASSAAIKGNQLFGPYGVSGATRYLAGSINTAKGFTGQYNDTLTGLDYYNARYYDPAVGVFLSADVKQGNEQGMNPYGYVNGNPETHNDPNGYRPIPVPQGPPMTTQDVIKICLAYESCAHKLGAYNGELFKEAVLTGLSWFVTGLEVIPAVTEAWFGNPEMLQADEQEFEQLSEESVGLKAIEDMGCSFTSATVVETLHGKQAIGKVRAGEDVLAYNPQTHKMEWQPIVHVWIHQDNDLVDLTITTPTQSSTRTGTRNSPQTYEVVHTNKKHPFFTMEKGFLPVGQIKIGMHILRADGRVGIVTAWTLVPGVQTMYNLEVAQDHTFTVGDGEWIVHNCTPSEFSNGINNLLNSSNRGAQQNAMIAKLAEDENFTLTEFRTPVSRADGSQAGDIDLGTSDTIVESKVGKSLDQGDRDQLLKLLGQGPDGQYVNPGGRRALIYYAPDLNPADVSRIENAGGYVAQNPEQFIALLSYFDPSWS